MLSWKLRHPPWPRWRLEEQQEESLAHCTALPGTVRGTLSPSHLALNRERAMEASGRHPCPENQSGSAPELLGVPLVPNRAG